MVYHPRKLEPGDQLQLKKPHPCGGSLFSIVRAGMDVRLQCLQCGSQIRLPRKKLEKMISGEIITVDKTSEPNV